MLLNGEKIVLQGRGGVLTLNSEYTPWMSIGLAGATPHHVLSRGVAAGAHSVPRHLPPSRGVRRPGRAEASGGPVADRPRSLSRAEEAQRSRPRRGSNAPRPVPPGQSSQALRTSNGSAAQELVPLPPPLAVARARPDDLRSADQVGEAAAWEALARWPGTFLPAGLYLPDAVSTLAGGGDAPAGQGGRGRVLHVERALGVAYAGSYPAALLAAGLRSLVNRLEATRVLPRLHPGSAYWRAVLRYATARRAGRRPFLTSISITCAVR